jgi:hypothetical protein
MTWVALRVAAGDDVLVHLVGDLLRALFVEIDDRRNVPRDVVGEQVGDLHRRALLHA